MQSLQGSSDFLICKSGTGSFQGERDTTVSWWSPCECELKSEIRQISEALREKESQICDLVVDLGLEGVDL